jgi:uncharacterized protein YegL
MTTRRLPVYLLLDCSESMAGPAIEAVGRGVETLVGELRSNPQAVETAHLSVITFSREARQDVPLTELMSFQIPKLRVRPGTALGAALWLLKDRIGREVVKNAEGVKGDYKPLIFLLTDGQPTDDWKDAADSIKQNVSKLANIIAIGCGPDVDIQSLYHITNSVLLMPDLTQESIRKFFVWLSSSVQAASVRVDGGGSDNNPFGLTAPPPDSLEVANQEMHGPTDGGMPRQVFLHGLCSQTRRPYLMRYVRREYEERYDAVAAHPLESLDEADAGFLPPINSSLLLGCPACPYCEHKHTGVCPCGALFCAPDNTSPIVCPRCDAMLGGTTGRSEFEISRSDG